MSDRVDGQPIRARASPVLSPASAREARNTGVTALLCSAFSEARVGVGRRLCEGWDDELRVCTRACSVGRRGHRTDDRRSDELGGLN